MRVPSIRVQDSYVIAGDEIPRPGSRFYTFPSLAMCSDGSIVCLALVGTEKTGPDGRIRAFRSSDGCRTWREMPSPTLWDERADPDWGYVVGHVLETSPGCFLSAHLKSDRTIAADPLFHPVTSGMKRSVVRLAHSSDSGRTWSRPRDLDYTLPDIIVPGRPLRLSDGSIGMPVEVWHEWDKGWREYPSTRLILSLDGGRTWPLAGLIARDESRCCIYGDPRLALSPDGRLIALMWAHNFVESRDLPVHRSESRDNGRTWSIPHDTGLVGQIANPVWLRDGLLMAVYQRRFGPEAGIRAVISRDAGMTFDPETDVPLLLMGHHTDNTNPFSGYVEAYTFGYSSVLCLSDTVFLVSFWQSNGRTTFIRALKVEVR